MQRHAGIGYELVQALDALVLQMVEQLPNVIQFFATHLPVVAEPVIEVPKTLPDRVPQRFVERHPPQNAEQSVEVPTIVSYSSLQGIAEQIADIPVPPGRGGWRGFEDLPPGQDSTAFGGAEHVAIPVPGGSFHVLPDPGGSQSSAVSREEAGQGFFSDSSLGQKKSEVRWESECGAAPGGQLMDAGVVEMLFRCSSRIRPKDKVPQLLFGQSSASGVRLSDAAARWQAQDLGSEFWPKRACRFLLQGGCQQGQACTFAHSVHRLHPDVPWEEFVKLFRVGEQDAGDGVW